MTSSRALPFIKSGRYTRKPIVEIFLLCCVMISIYNIFGSSSRMDALPSFTIISDMPLCENRSSKAASNNGTIVAGSNVVVRVNKRPRLFHCGGYALNRNFKPTLISILPSSYEWIDLRQMREWKSESMLANSSNPWDIFVSNYQVDGCENPDFFQWLHLRFSGKHLFWTPEDATNYLSMIQKEQFYPIGPGAPLTLTFLQTAFWAQVPDNEKLDYFFGGFDGSPPRRPQSTRKHFLIYAHSNCVDEREEAFRTIANYQNGVFPSVYYGGKCNGNLNQHKNASKVQKYNNKVRLGNWEDNRHVYRDFRFCLTMEHRNTPGYITEKILVAFWSGCIPIYWGPKDTILEMFDSESFIYWDVTNPKPALSRLLYLESNETAFNESMARPIFAPHGAEQYFSLDDRFGNGALKSRIQEYLGLNAYRFDQ